MKKWNKTEKNHKIKNSKPIITSIMETSGMKKERKTIKKANFRYFKEKE